MAFAMAKGPNKSTCVTCLFCSHPVLVNQDTEDTDPEATLEWSRLIKTLCFHMQLDSRKVPEHCTVKTFPLCKLCEQHAFNLYESQKKIDDAQRVIEKTVCIIERTVADAEILSPSLPTGSSSAEGKKLRDKILEGYRAKLLMKAKLRENLILGNGKGKEGIIYDMPTSSHTVLMHDPKLRRQFNAGRSGAQTPSTLEGNNARRSVVPTPSTSQGINAGRLAAPTPSTSQSNSANGMMNVGASVSSTPAQKAKNKEQEEQAVYTTGSKSNNGPTEVRDSNVPENQVLPRRPPPVLPMRGRTCRKSTAGNPSAAARVAPGSPPSRMIAKYNESSCTMTISKVRLGSAEPPSLDPSIVIKQEPGESPVPVPVQQGKRKRRSLFQGIEILKMSEPSTNKVYLQCSICRFAILLSNPVNSETSPHQTMTQHITDRHLSKRRRAALQMAASTRLPGKEKRTQFTCKICFTVFPDMRALVHHKTTHTAEERTAREVENAEIGMPRKAYYIPNLQCNICGRPIKGNYNNLEAHKFSHKNNEERAEALRNNERGARNALVRQLPVKPSVSTVVKEKPNKIRRLKRGRKGKAIPGGIALGRKKRQAAMLEEKEKATSFQCQLCPRAFNRNCHLFLHMKKHYRQNKLAAATKAVVSEPSSPPVMDPQVNATQIPEENPQTCEVQTTNSADEVSAEFSNEEIDNYLAEAETEALNGDESQV